MPTNKKSVKKDVVTIQKESKINQVELMKALEQYFGFTAFKGTQEKAIHSLLSGRDTFVIMPTGGGKSLCYQLPALIQPGCAIVVSPLIALMKNQVDAIRSLSHESVAHFLNSSISVSVSLGCTRSPIPILLNGFPDNYEFPSDVAKASRMKQLGNSVAVTAIQAWGEAVIKALD